MKYLKSINENFENIKIPTFRELGEGIRSGKIKCPIYGNLYNRFFFPDTDVPVCVDGDLKYFEKSYYEYSYAIFTSPKEVTKDIKECILIFEDGEPVAIFPKTDGGIKFEGAIVLWSWNGWFFQSRGDDSIFPKIWREYELFIFNLDSGKLERDFIETPHKFSVEAEEFSFEMPYKKVIKCRERTTGIVKFFNLKAGEFFPQPSKTIK